MVNENTRRYVSLLADCFKHPVNTDVDNGVAYELISAQIRFKPMEHIFGSSESYIKHELSWYLSQDRCIKNHPGIENNKIWQSCATDTGFVNSNYGWCIYSDANFNQFDSVIAHLCSDESTRHACMVYTRPSIHVEYCDGIHAKRDMFCTMYTDTMVRNNRLIYIVHMRSNDIWYGLRNDLAWHQFVQQQLLEKCKQVKPDVFHDIILGDIIWNADSLHAYSRNISAIKKYVADIITADIDSSTRKYAADIITAGLVLKK